MDRWMDTHVYETYVCMYECMYICIYIWMDGWILTVDLLPVRGPDPGTPPASRGGDRAAHTHAPDPTRMHCTQGPTDCKQSGMNKPSLLKQLASWGQTGCSRLPPSPKESSLQEETPKHGAFSYAKSCKQSELLIQVSATPSMTSARTNHGPPMATSQNTKVQKRSSSGNGGILLNSQPEDLSSSPNGGAG